MRYQLDMSLAVSAGSGLDSEENNKTDRGLQSASVCLASKEAVLARTGRMRGVLDGVGVGQVLHTLCDPWEVPIHQLLRSCNKTRLLHSHMCAVEVSPSSTRRSATPTCVAFMSAKVPTTHLRMFSRATAAALIIAGSECACRNHPKMATKSLLSRILTDRQSTIKQHAHDSVRTTTASADRSPNSVRMGMWW